jgi:hypothetical protein
VNEPENNALFFMTSLNVRLSLLGGIKHRHHRQSRQPVRRDTSERRLPLTSRPTCHRRRNIMLDHSAARVIVRGQYQMRGTIQIIWISARPSCDRTKANMT